MTRIISYQQNFKNLEKAPQITLQRKKPAQCIKHYPCKAEDFPSEAEPTDNVDIILLICVRSS